MSDHPNHAETAEQPKTEDSGVDPDAVDTDKSDNTAAPSPETPILWGDLEAIRQRLHQAEGLLFATDFDGTLSPIEETPDKPEPTQPNLDSLTAFRDHPLASPAVISGRGLDDLRTRVGIEGIDYIGNHGLELGLDGGRQTHPDAEAAKPVIDEICTMLSDRLAEFDGVIIENKGVTATIHYRLVDRSDVETVKQRIAETVEEVDTGDVEIHAGKESRELRPVADGDKGTAIDALRTRVEHGWLPMYIGDDTTDETAFRAIGDDGVTVHVGTDADTDAAYRVRSPAEAEVFIRWLVTDGLAILESNEKSSPA